MSYVKKQELISPMSPEDILTLDNICPTEDRRPFGKVTASSRSFWVDRDAQGDSLVDLSRSSLAEGAFELATTAGINFGLPVQRLVEGETLALLEKRERSPFKTVDGYVPEGIPVSYHPKLVTGLKRTVARKAGGGRVLLSADPHVTIHGDESRTFLYPDSYPFSAVCKLVVDSQAQPGGPWSSQTHATGFLVGRKTLMTSGHVHPDFSGNAWRIKVIPACWGGRSVYGMGYITYARSAYYWHSDSGNDFMVCELYDAIGDDLGYFGAVSYDSDWEDRAVWSMAGYPYDRSLWGLSYQNGISVRDDDDGDDISVAGESYDTTQVENDADEASGASGSPLFAVFNGDILAVGVHHGVEYDWTVSGTETLSCASGGEGFVEVIRWARNQWG